MAHAASCLDTWLNVYAQGHDSEACDAWLLSWPRRQQAAGDEATETPFAEARSALDRVIQRSTPFINALSEEDLRHLPKPITENGWSAGMSVGYLIARAVAHLFAHASELNGVVTASGAPDLGLPGWLAHTFGDPPAADAPR